MKVYTTSRTLDSFEGSRDCPISREKRREANFKDCLGPGSIKKTWGVWNSWFFLNKNIYMESAGKTRRHFHRWWSGCCPAGQGGKVAWWNTSGGALVLALVALLACWAGRPAGAGREPVCAGGADPPPPTNRHLKGRSSHPPPILPFQRLWGANPENYTKFTQV